MTNWAIIIGVDRYIHQAKLRNAVTDTKLISRILTRHYKFERSKITSLLDRNATRSRILRLIQEQMNIMGLNNMVTEGMEWGNGAGSFPLLASVDHDARDRGTACLPSTITTPIGIPAIIRLRTGKFCGAGCHSTGNSLMIAPYSGSLIKARLAMEFGREVFGVPGNVTQDVSFRNSRICC